MEKKDFVRSAGTVFLSAVVQGGLTHLHRRAIFFTVCSGVEERCARHEPHVRGCFWRGPERGAPACLLCSTTIYILHARRMAHGGGEAAIIITTAARGGDHHRAGAAR